MPPLQNILFLDIETASQFQSFDSLPDTWKELWSVKAESLMRFHAGETAESLYGRAAIYAEFGKVICISCGYIQGSGEEKKMVMKSFFGDDEKTVLQQFCGMLTKWEGTNKFLCAHNGKEFDFPYLCRRMIIHGMKLPHCLQTGGKKPWEVAFLDTLELWKFGDYKNYTSLKLLAHVLNIPSPKDDIDGSMVGDVYWGASTPADRHQSLARIAAYCQKDVVTAAQVYLRLQGESLIYPENIEIKDNGPN